MSFVPKRPVYQIFHSHLNDDETYTIIRKHLSTTRYSLKRTLFNDAVLVSEVVKRRMNPEDDHEC